MLPPVEQAALLGVPQWGNIKDVLNAPLIDVPPDASWFSVLFMWLLLPLNLIQGIIGGLIPCVMVCMSIGTCCIPCSASLCSAMGSVLRGRPCWMAWTWWRYVIGGLTALIANGQSRLALFIWEWRAFGSKRFWWHGEGIWMWSYADCDRILKSQQLRHSAFGAVSACIPDLFATNILIFLSNEGGSDSHWASIRKALHNSFLDRQDAGYTERVEKLRSLVAADWPNPQFEQLNDVEKIQRSVSKCVFYVMFNIWLDDADAQILTGWRTNATFFILPRLIQRFIFNVGINKVKQLRTDTVGLIEKHNLQGHFVNMNDSLPQRWKRQAVVKLCDEIMYVIGFAGIGGTCAAVESCASFLQVKIPKESAAEHIKFGVYDTPQKMVGRFMQDPDSYIRETLRMDPPVTSATGVLKEVTTAELAGNSINFPPGLLNQYVLSMANREPTYFPSPEVFTPDRANLNMSLTWNGAFGTKNDEVEYPRICPGRFLSMDITKAILSHVLQTTPMKLNQYRNTDDAAMGSCF